MNITKRAFLILLVLATALTLLVGVAGCKPQEPTFTSQGEEAVYYSLNETGEDTIELKQGLFTLAIGGDSKTGSYTFDKSKGEVVLDFGNATVIQAQLNLTKGELRIRYGNKNYVMIKKVNFTVTFEVSGGSQVASQSVLNGGLATKPSDPTKTGYAFTGWYKDANANGAYNDGEAVTDDIVKILADYKVSDLNAGFSDRLLAEMKSSVKLSKFMAYDSCSIFKLFSEAEYNELTIDTLPTALSSKLNKDITLGALVDVGMITTSGADAMLTTERQATIEMLINGTKPATDPTYRSWRTVTISEFFSLAFEALDTLSQIPGLNP